MPPLRNAPISGEYAIAPLKPGAVGKTAIVCDLTKRFEKTPTLSRKLGAAAERWSQRTALAENRHG